MVMEILLLSGILFSLVVIALLLVKTNSLLQSIWQDVREIEIGMD